MRLTDEERAEARSRPFPIQTSRMEGVPSHPLTIPWSVADKAGCEYTRRYGDQQSIERLAQRGGLSGGEMDDLYPAWREEVSEIAALKARIAELEREKLRTAEERINRNLQGAKTIVTDEHSRAAESLLRKYAGGISINTPLAQDIAFALADREENAIAWCSLVTDERDNRIAELKQEQDRLRGLLKAPGLYPPTDETDRKPTL